VGESVDPLAELNTDAADKSAPPPVLLAPQKAWVEDHSPFKLGEKSRRIGLTWAEAADNVLAAAAEDGSNVFYIGPTQDMAEEYIDACGMWARAFNYAASEIEEGIFDDTDEGGDTKHIKTYKISFPGSRKRIVALSSRPTNLRGKQGVIVIDEAAFHPDLKGLLKAAMAMLLWGDKVHVLSTHNGVDNYFNELIQEARAGKRKGSVHRITFREAVAAGLYQRVCLRRGIEWTAEGEAVWVKDAYDFYADDADEELDVVPSQSGGAFLTMALIEARMMGAGRPNTPIVRGKWKAEFALTPEWERRVEIERWCEEELRPHLDALETDLRHSFGQDFGRVSDLTSVDVLAEGGDLVRRVKLHVELSNCPFRQQEQILTYIVSRLPRFTSGVMDAGGNGAALAEYMADEFGSTKIEQLKLSEQFYIEQMPRFKAALQDATLADLPRDREIRDDLRALRVINGVPKLPKEKTQKGDGPKAARHGDAAISLFLAEYASRREVTPMEYDSTGEVRASSRLDDYMMA
jgi:phage FluMu gp28-like protein